VGGDLSTTDTAGEEDGDGGVEGQNELDEQNELNFGGRNELDVDGSLKKIRRERGRCGIGKWMMGFGRAFRQPSGESGGDCRGNPPGFR
jgi:hypothetical protein